MLDSDTKRRINTCRDILVGKVPDPKSQVEQITIALIYKFMDDMDLEAEELGGARSFFTGDFERYRFSKLVAPGVGGQEMLNLYTEALTKMVENPDLPELFRSIFRNAYLPYRDPETLRSFLREVNGFTYDHSERLGDAFEYLLSVLGSQGDAGQFRTPRHIIDFMVEIIDPQKNEVILDPACGTAGFLISAYKHILKRSTTGAANGNGNGVEGDAAEQALESPQRYKGDLLSPDERARLARNIKGYDISPDMVRLSRVNMFLHAFKEPLVEEYDTLTSDDKWGETADVILANPPFMSPKGGIIPHNKFQVPSKRSEVLFVDYIAEHLTPNGRAAIVVPEGIIFQSQSAYVALRKMLVEGYLAAVISLPAGVFNPYSGVKTSILILDRAVAKASTHVAFFKVENDGFGLGAQRRAVKGSQLPQVKSDLSAWLKAARSSPGEELRSELGNTVARAKLAEDGDYNLSADRYRSKAAVEHVWPMVALGDVTRRVSGGTPSKANEAYWNGDIPWVSPKDMKVDVIVDTEDHVSEAAVEGSATSLVPPGTILAVVRSGILQHSFPVAITSRELCFNQDLIGLIPDESQILGPFLFWNLKARGDEILAEGIKPGVTVQSFHSGFFQTLRIPLPPLAIQREIVAEIESYQRVIDGARAVLESYRPHIPIDPEWPIVPMADIADFKNGLNFTKSDEGESVRIVGVSDFQSNTLVPSDSLATIQPDASVGRDYLLQPGDILFVRSNGNPDLVGRSMLAGDEIGRATFSGFTIRARFDAGRVNPRYLAYFFKTPVFSDKMKQSGQGANIRNLSQGILADLKVPLPDLDTQAAIVAEIEAEQVLVNGNRDLVDRFEKKIDFTIARVWGEASDQETA
ncbi:MULTISPECIES: N-6 DNA methylase [unclassified Brevundimonas]|uniref:N-6 DNA methylase n=1 Tax=unclassified Brevundimonas TaxID=2622653 RepID=UPI0025BE00A0|nr:MULTISPECIES: N-6 DNA methylase [unclassified Brevundimonas]